MSEGDENYLMDHTIVIFLVNPEGKSRKPRSDFWTLCLGKIEEYFTQYKTPGEIIFTTVEKMKLWKVQKDFVETMRKIDARKAARAAKE